MRNPVAPPAIQGIPDYASAPSGFYDRPFNYTFDITLAANQLVNGSVVSIFTEADFCWRGMVFSSTGLFSVQFQDGQGYYLSNNLMLSSNMPNTAGDPWPVFPEVVYPAGGRIYLNIGDSSGAENTIQILFLGVNRYRY
jgi:hypothetical protein